MDARAKPNQLNQPKYKKKEIKYSGIYSRSLITSSITLPITSIGKNIQETIEKTISNKFEGKCVVEGFIQPKSVKIISYSSGNIISDLIEFHVVYECMIAHPVEGMLMEAECKTITKAGIHAQVVDEDGNIPITVFVAKDHHHIDQLFNSIVENDKITVSVIGTRYELNDPYICVISKLVSVDNGKHKQGDMQQGDRQQGDRQPKINILDEY